MPSPPGIDILAPLITPVARVPQSQGNTPCPDCPPLTCLASALLALTLTFPAAIAQDRPTTSIPALMADAHPTPWGGRAVYRILLANKGTDRVTGGALSITYEIACTLTADPNGPPCPSVPTLRRKTTMPCGEDEAGLISVNLGTAPYAGLTTPYTLTLTIRAIDFLAWSDATIDRINAQYPQRYQYNSSTRRYDRVDGDTCPKTNHTPTRVVNPPASTTPPRSWSCDDGPDPMTTTTSRPDHLATGAAQIY